MANRRSAVTPFVFRDDHDGTTGTDIHIARRLASVLKGEQAPRFRVNMPMSADSWVREYLPDAAMEGWSAPVHRPKAIIGVIDDGLPFAHRAFLGSDGRTRFSHLWLQSGRARERDAVPFGREIKNREIDELRRDHGPDERLIYRRSGAIDPALAEIGRILEQHATHGAHVAALAAGNDPALVAEALPDEVLIIGAQLPNTIAWDTSGFGKEMYMLSALHYVFNRARAIAARYADDPADPRELPLVVNFSYGWSASRHDGQSEMETAIEELLSARRQPSVQPLSAIVMPMGNNFAQAMHAQFTAGDLRNGAWRIGWRLLPDDRTSSYLEIWLPRVFEPYGWQVQVTLPGQRSPAVALEIERDPDEEGRGDPRRFEELEIDGKNIGQISADKNRGTRWRVLLAVIPTAYVRGEDRRAPFGRWEIAIVPSEKQPLPEGETILGAARRRSASDAFKWAAEPPEEIDGAAAGGDERNDTGLGIVRGYGCYNGIASAKSTTRVAGIVASTKEAAPYSGAGGLEAGGTGLEPWSVQPDLGAVSDQSLMLPGVSSIGVVSGSFARLVGTSAAAAAASRTMVRNAAAGRDLMAGLELPGPVPVGFVQPSSAE
ncbi:MAG: hypothetical protein R3D25_15640 [Geminicoccaceae bacterium]